MKQTYEYLLYAIILALLAINLLEIQTYCRLRETTMHLIEHCEAADTVSEDSINNQKTNNEWQQITGISK